MWHPWCSLTSYNIRSLYVACCRWRPSGSWLSHDHDHLPMTNEICSQLSCPQLFCQISAALSPLSSLARLSKRLNFNWNENYRVSSTASCMACPYYLSTLGRMYHLNATLHVYAYSNRNVTQNSHTASSGSIMTLYLFIEDAVIITDLFWLACLAIWDTTSDCNSICQADVTQCVHNARDSVSTTKSR